MKQKKNQFELKGWGLASYLAVGIASIIGLGMINSNRIEKAKQRELEKIATQNNAIAVQKINELVDEINSQLPRELDYSQEDKKLVTNILYGEAANQSRLGRKIIARMTLNRERELEYPSNIKDVIYDHLAISCIKDKKNKNWKQATVELPRNGYQEMIYQRCGEDANSILNGERLGIPFEDEIIAYHDTSIKYEDLVAKEKKIQEKWKKKGKRWDGFWMHLEPVIKEGDLIFYKEKN